MDCSQVETSLTGVRGKVGHRPRVPPEWVLQGGDARGCTSLDHYSLTLCTDASLTGWGAVWGELQLSGLWRPYQTLLLFSILEMKAVLLMLCAWGPLLQSQTVRLFCDNSTVVTDLR